MNAILVLYAISTILLILVVVTKNKPEKQLARKTWLKIAVIFIIVASVNWILIN
ncbi:hypothetical protein [uncultured Paraglaciecola sp.]|uniref:hypothetical protein n=1 Tax=uncultured Paraglaciecola sp. TaxID=1765024 RepID=UPI0030DD5A3A